MNDKDPLSDSTVSLLRGPLPDHDPRPGFENRLMANIHAAAEPRAPRVASPWLLAGLGSTVLVAAIAAALLRPEPSPPMADTPPAKPDPAAPSPVEIRPVYELEKLPNPLEEEALAVGSSATRVGRFLLSHLPSLPDPDGESL